MTREQIIADLEFALANGKIPEEGLSELGPVFLTRERVFELVSTGALMTISRRYVEAIVEELRALERGSDG